MAGTPHEAVEALVERLEQLNAAYRSGAPEVSDADYDDLVEQLRALAPEHAWLAAVEPEPDFGEGKVRHPSPMLSTEKAYTLEALQAWVDRLERVAAELGLEGLQVRVTPKLDGLAGRDDGAVFSTRGNGRVGSDITRAFERGVVPVGGRGLGVGEIVMVKSWFYEHLEGVFDHPRNTCVGIVTADVVGGPAQSALDAGVVRFVPYSTLPSWTGSGADLVAQVTEITQDLKSRVDYPLDGMVAEAVDERLRERMGATSHHHRWQIAIKERGETAETRVLEIIWQTGRTGNVTPVLLVEPVKVSGATIGRVTAHHAGMVRDKLLGPGARVQIIRSGEVIPKLEEVLQTAEIVQLPSECPRCSAPLTWRNDFLVCPDTQGCPAQVETGLRHFFKTLRSADNFGPKTLERLVAAGFDTLERIYAVTEDELIGLEFGPGQTKNLLEALQTSLTRTVEDARFLAAFGIPDLGVGDSRKLLGAFRLEELDQVTSEQLIAVKGFGEITSLSIVSGLAERWSTLRHMLDLGFSLERTPLAEEAPTIDSPVAGKKVLFTGKMVLGTREAMQEQAKALGAALASGISKQLDLLVVGEKPSPKKVDKAQGLGVRVLTEAQWIELVAVGEE